MKHLFWLAIALVGCGACGCRQQPARWDIEPGIHRELPRAAEQPDESPSFTFVCNIESPDAGQPKKENNP